MKSLDNGKSFKLPCRRITWDSNVRLCHMQGDCFDLGCRSRRKVTLWRVSRLQSSSCKLCELAASRPHWLKLLSYLLSNSRKIFLIGHPSGRPFTIGAIVNKTWHNMNMDVRNDLICRDPIVLSDIESISFYGRDDCLCYIRYKWIKPANLGGRHVKEVVIVSGWNYQSMSNVNGILVHNYQKIVILVDTNARLPASNDRAENAGLGWHLWLANISWVVRRLFFALHWGDTLRIFKYAVIPIWLI